MGHTATYYHLRRKIKWVLEENSTLESHVEKLDELKKETRNVHPRTVSGVV